MPFANHFTNGIRLTAPVLSYSNAENCLNLITLSVVKMYISEHLCDQPGQSGNFPLAKLTVNQPPGNIDLRNNYMILVQINHKIISFH